MYICIYSSSSIILRQALPLFQCSAYNILRKARRYTYIPDTACYGMLLTFSCPSFLLQISIVSVLPQLQSFPVSALLPFQTTKHRDIMIPTLSATLQPVFHGGAA